MLLQPLGSPHVRADQDHLLPLSKATLQPSMRSPLSTSSSTQEGSSSTLRWSSMRSPLSSTASTTPSSLSNHFSLITSISLTNVWLQEMQKDCPQEQRRIPRDMNIQVQPLSYFIQPIVGEHQNCLVFHHSGDTRLLSECECKVCTAKGLNRVAKFEICKIFFINCMTMFSMFALQMVSAELQSLKCHLDLASVQVHGNHVVCPGCR